MNINKEINSLWAYTDCEEFNQQAEDIYDQVLIKYDLYDAYYAYKQCVLPRNGKKYIETKCVKTGELNNCSSCLQTNAMLDSEIWYTTKGAIYKQLGLYVEPNFGPADKLLNLIKQRSAPDFDPDDTVYNANIELFTQLSMLFHNYGVKIPTHTN